MAVVQSFIEVLWLESASPSSPLSSTSREVTQRAQTTSRSGLKRNIDSNGHDPSSTFREHALWRWSASRWTLHTAAKMHIAVNWANIQRGESWKEFVD